MRWQHETAVAAQQRAERRIPKLQFECCAEDFLFWKVGCQILKGGRVSVLDVDLVP
jgi:hypothetical protein